MINIKGVIEKIVGSENVSNDDFELTCYSKGCNPDVPQYPLMIVRPRTVEEISSILVLANRVKVPVACWSGATNAVGAIAGGTILLDMTSMNKIVEIDDENLTVSVQAGITWGELLTQLERKGWTTGPCPQDGLASTVGGGVALSNNAVWSGKYGLVGEQIVGLQVVIPTGEILQTGSAANPNSKKFYRYAWASDLTGLFIGSHGILGVITEVTLKMYPLPEVKESCGFGFESLESAIRALHEIQKTRIPIEYAGIALKEHNPQFEFPATLVPIIVSGAKEEVEVELKRIRQLCIELGGKEISKEIAKEQAEGVEMARYNTAYIFGNELPPGNRKLVNMHPCCSCLPTLDVPRLINEVKQFIEESGIKKFGINVAFAIWACQSCVICSPLVYYDANDSKAEEIMRKFILQLFDRISNIGFTPHYLGRLRSPAVMGKLGTYNKVLGVIKKALDPNNILNPMVLPYYH
jgi:glycolate oxidase